MKVNNIYFSQPQYYKKNNEQFRKNNILNSSCDSFVSHKNNNLSFSGTYADTFNVYSKQYKGFSTFIPADVFNLIDSLDEEGFVVKDVARWESTLTNENEGISTGYSANGKLLAVMIYQTFKKRDIWSEELKDVKYPKKIVIYNPVTQKAEKKIAVTINECGENFHPHIKTKTLYYPDGITPKYEVTPQYFPYPKSVYEVFHYNTEGVKDKKYTITSGYCNKAEMEEYSKKGETIAHLEFHPSPDHLPE